MYSRPSIALSFVTGSLLVKGKKPFAFIKILAEDITAADSLQVHFSKKAPFNFDFFLFLNHFSKRLARIPIFVCGSQVNIKFQRLLDTPHNLIHTPQDL